MREGWDRMMSQDDVLEIVGRLEAAGVPVWLDGGWGVDALLGTEHRPHRDVDVVLRLADAERALAALAPLGFGIALDALNPPARPGRVP